MSSCGACNNKWAVLVVFLDKSKPNLVCCKRHIPKIFNEYFRMYNFSKNGQKVLMDSCLPDEIIQQEQLEMFNMTHCCMCQKQLRNSSITCSTYLHNVCLVCFETHSNNSIDNESFNGHIQCPMSIDCRFDTMHIVECLPKRTLRRYQTILSRFPKTREDIRNIMRDLLNAEDQRYNRNHYYDGFGNDYESSETSIDNNEDLFSLDDSEFVNNKPHIGQDIKLGTVKNG